MAKDSINIIERHLEKIVLGLAGVFALAMLYMYMLNTPNRVDYKGQSVGPRKLDEEILSSANALQRAVRGATPDEVSVTKFSEQLRRNQEDALIAASARDAGPALPPKLRLAAAFGGPISVPGLEESEGSGEIVLVTPLAPSVPKLITGRSVAVRTEMLLADQNAPEPGKSKEPEEAGEFPWVSIGGYWDKQAQRVEMTAAKYAAYRTKVYVARVDAQRQEMLATGEFSGWKDVARSKAGVNIPIRDPIFDDQTGAIVNKDRIEKSYRQVKDYQHELMQPMFYPVMVGDDWEVPPIEGFTDDYVGGDEIDQQRQEAREKKKREREERRKEQRGRRGRAPIRGGGGHGGGGGAMGEGGGATVAVVRPSNRGQSDSKTKSAARKLIREDLKQARQALGDKDFNLAINLANRVFNNQYASIGNEKEADKIIIRAQRAQDMEDRRMGTQDEGLEFIYHPESQSKMAIWFHDDTVEPGKTYRYRLRVNLWNRYVGQIKSLRDPQEAKSSMLYGDWSLASEPIAVTPSTYFFLSSGTFDQSGANVDVFKWRQGDWMKQRFIDVQIGQIIGEVKKVKTDDFDDDGKPLREDVDFSTGAVVLDLRFAEPIDLRTPGRKGEFSYREQPSVVMVYLEPADGQVKERVLALERHDPLRKKLEGK